ncbi:MAG TPA: hypothetical protein VGO68_11850 [Pyrinomonadaceae bacterium]|jgi:hypothetical protein|nr:hypothetical protein [Pyrinomonadaceae bacterium]
MQPKYEPLHRALQMTLIVLAAMLLLPGLGCKDVSAQATSPLEEEQFLGVLRKRALPLAELASAATTRGIAFPMTAAVEDKIRRKGQYLGETDLDKLIDVLRANYRPHERLRVSLVSYVPCGQNSDEFVDLLSSKVIALSGSLILRDNRSTYTAGLRLVKEQKPAVMSLLDANEYWEKTQSLQLVKAICTPKGKDVYVISQVFLGNLRGRLGDPVRIEFKVDSDEYATTRDIHSLLILYSLAKDSQARGLSKDLTQEYLSEALKIADQITMSDTATLRTIRTAIENTLQELGATDLFDPKKNRN